MPRVSRIVVPDLPHHVTHRGNQRQPIFFESEDRDRYLSWLSEYCERQGAEIWAYCLMGNHIHLIVLPRREDSLARTIGLTHQRFAQWQNRRHGGSGHLWSNRFYSSVLDEPYLWAAVRYVETNPVRAGLVDRAEDYPWSSAIAHGGGRHDPHLAPFRPFPGPIPDWCEWLANGQDQSRVGTVRDNTTSGWPSGSPDFVKHLEERLGRALERPKMGRPTSSLS